MNFTERMNSIMDKLKKSKKAIVFSAALVTVVCCSLVLMGVWAGSAARPVSAPPMQTDAINDRPRLTWKAVKELVEGNLSYQDILGPFYYKEIGSGLYVITFPIEDAPEFSLVVSSTSPSSSPMTVGLRCEPADLLLKLNAENLQTMMDLHSNSSLQQEINKLFYNEIPIPQDAKTYGNMVYLTGRAPGEIIQAYGNMLLNNGWELTDTLGTKRFYKKSINGSEIIVSINIIEVGKAQGKGVVIKFDPHTRQDNNTFSIEPSGTMSLSPELLEKVRKSKEESKKVRTGLFNTELDIKHEENRVVAFISFYNISQEDLKLDFNVGGEFDFTVTDSEGNEVYSAFHGGKDGLPAISNYKLKKGEKLAFSYSWDYNDNNGNKVVPGKYFLTVKMLPMINYKRNFCPDELTAVKDIEVNYN